MAQKRIWSQLPVDIEERIINFLPQNEIACTVRLLSKAAAARYNYPPCTTVRLSSPVPNHAFTRRWLLGTTRTLPFKARNQLLCLTAATGDLANLEVAVAAAGCVPTGKVLEAAAAAGHLHICTWLRQQGCPWGWSLAAAARAGRREVCEWLLSNGCLCGTLAVNAAARGGHGGLMDWLLQQVPSPDAYFRRHLLALAAEGYDLRTFQQQVSLNAWQPQDHEHPHLTEDHRGRVLAAAAGSPTPDWRDKVEWLESQGYPPTWRACRAAAARPDALDRLIWLRQRGYPADEWAAMEAVRAGNVAALEYLLGEADVRAESWRMAHLAAKGGHLGVLQALHAHGCRVEGATAALCAAEGGHLAVVVWVVETLGLGGEEDLRGEGPALLNAAAHSGSVELLSWLHGRGFRWEDGEVLAAAARGGCEEALEWLVERGCPLPTNGEPYSVAAMSGDLATLRCLRRLGCAWGSSDTFADCIRASAPMAVLRWMVEEGCPVHWRRALQAARSRWWLTREEREQLTVWLRAERRKQWRQRRRALAGQCRRKLGSLVSCLHPLVRG